MTGDELRTLSGAVPADAIEKLIADGPLEQLLPNSDSVLRGDAPINAATAREVLDHVVSRGMDPAASDAWMAPRLHSALRLTRREAADDGLWRWLAATLGADYVRWRWMSPKAAISADRFNGAVNKQALARLWWAAELLRNGSDYSVVGTFFEMQDFPNSLLHRPLMRHRAFAIALVEQTFAEAAKEARKPSGDEVNAVAEAANLFVVPRSLRAIVGSESATGPEYNDWLAADPPGSWTALPKGPLDAPIGADALERARSVARLVVEAGFVPDSPLMRSRKKSTSA